MGILDHIRKATKLPSTLADLPPVSVASPMAPRPNHLESIVWADLLGREYGPITRADAMTVPSIVRGRGLIVTTIARAKLEAVDATGKPIEQQPIWLGRTNGPTSPFHRMLATADDLLFYGWSLWAVRRDYDGKVIEADHVAIDSWAFDDDGRIKISDKFALENEVILIPGIHEGILTFGRETISQARGLLASAERAATQPSAMVELHQTNTAPITDAQIDALIARWHAARRGENAGVAFTTNGIETKEHGSFKEHLLIEGRAASALDLARLLGIPAPMIDATQAGASMSYSNTASRMNELIAFGIAPMMAAIAARLSQDDVLPNGTSLIFDTSDVVASVEADFQNDYRRPRRGNHGAIPNQRDAADDGGLGSTRPE